MTYCFGIYYYIDKETGNIVYIGKDSHIDIKRRHICHSAPCGYYKQPFNRVLQNNPERYEYMEYCRVSTIEELNRLEFDLINLYRPKFNFRHGGDEGLNLNKPFKYTVVKNGKTSSFRNSQQYSIFGKEKKAIIYSIDRDFLMELASKLNDSVMTEEDVINLDRFEYRVMKSGFFKTKEGRKQKYCICAMGGKEIINSINKSALEKIAKNLNEGKLSENEVRNSYGIGDVLELIS